jgi:hypothetical protein
LFEGKPLGAAQIGVDARGGVVENTNQVRPVFSKLTKGMGGQGGGGLMKKRSAGSKKQVEPGFLGRKF